jgi:hypothetical protein
MVQIEGLKEAEKLVEKYLRNMTASEVRKKSATTKHSFEPCSEIFRLSRASYRFPGPSADEQMLVIVSVRRLDNDR